MEDTWFQAEDPTARPKDIIQYFNSSHVCHVLAFKVREKRQKERQKKAERMVKGKDKCHRTLGIEACIQAGPGNQILYHTIILVCFIADGEDDHL